MSYANYINKTFKFNFGVISDDLKNSKNKDYFKPSGVSVYVGWQGGGKTLSAVYHVDRLMSIFPKCKLVTNIIFNNNLIDYSDRIIYFQSVDELAEKLVKVNNGEYGVIYLIDEIQTYFNALDSKNIPPYVFTEISQQRKQRKLIIGTSQLFLRMAKPFREQANYLIMCNTHFNLLTTQKVYNAHLLTTDHTGALIGHPIKRGFFFHSESLRNMYDTYQKVISGKAQFEELTQIESNKKSLKVLRGRSR